MEENANTSLEEDFEGQATHTGKETNCFSKLSLFTRQAQNSSRSRPKGVINDWRKFKLESEDRESLSLSKKEMLRQMSSPHRSFSRDDKDTRERFCRKMSMQEYELIHDAQEDESCLQQYRKRCMQDMHQRLSFGPKFGYLCELQNGEQFLEAVEKEHKTTTVIVHIYEDGVKGCDALNSSLTCLATEYPTVKFCKIKASSTGAGDRFSNEVLPSLLVYKAGELLSNFISVSEQFNEEFFAVDVEAFLNEYGLLPEGELPALGNGNTDEPDVE
ncbi:PHOS protein, partial [Mionectes macconnelli]|nr:PHOS protein [Mionectes macconnelli]